MMNFCEENGLPAPKRPRKKRKIPSGEDGGGGGEETASPSPRKKPRKLKTYVPTLRTGAYAIVLALSTLDENAHTGITKQQLIELAQPYSDASFTVPSDAGKFYTAWSSMRTLIDKDLVSEKGRPTRKYALTEEGWDVAKRMKKSSDPSQGRTDTFVAAQRPDPDDEDDFLDLGGSPVRPSTRARPSKSPRKEIVPDIIPQGEVVTSASALPSFAPIILEPSSFRVELVLDRREIFGKNDREYMQDNLTAKGVKPIMRSLELGDVLWVAKLHDPGLLSRRGAQGDEIMLDYIMERKRLDDLVGSIKDGRFHEQKFRLRKSGIKNVVYLVEEITMSTDHFQKYQEAVASAIASTQVVNGYFVKKTQKMDDTIRYLVSMTNLLKEKYERKPLHIIPTDIITTGNYLPLLDHLEKKDPGIDYHTTYPAFACLTSKSETLTLRDVYLKMLMCTKGVTGEKAIEIQKRWKTPIEFVEAYRKIEGNSGGGEQGKKKKWDMVSNEMHSLVARKKITKALSVKIAEVWGDASTAM